MGRWRWTASGERRTPRIAGAAVVALAALLFAPAAGVRGDPLPPLPGPAPQGRPQGFSARIENQRCEACHEDIAAEWRASLHRQAFTDRVFQRSYAIEPLPFCRGCHAPEADPAHHPGADAQAVGVGCVTCHLVAGEVVSARGRDARGGAHAVRGDARLSTDEGCARCHQFDFPRAPGVPMQDTVAEHRSGRFAERPCRDCHMQIVRGIAGRPHRDHRFSVVGDPAVLRSAIDASASRSGANAIEVSARVVAAGHAVPTGDMFRRLEVRASAVDAEGATVSTAAPVILERRFSVRPVEGGIERVLAGDTRLPASGAPRVLRLVFPAAIDGLAVRWEVVYQRMGAAMGAAFGVDPAADEVVLAAGTLGARPVIIGRPAPAPVP
ncbi:multiheme c-type cytochrome [Sorangium sp. So ce204]|uniref:multiheme c-type cytochrome n=1 Tax=Sorangium sp. So ce204 TaxID=3133288 RepID=UPI003F5D7C87